jgi:hypothetical protein
MAHSFLSPHCNGTLIPITSLQWHTHSYHLTAMAHSFLSPHVQWHTHSYHLTCNGTLIPITSRAMAHSFLSHHVQWHTNFLTPLAWHSAHSPSYPPHGTLTLSATTRHIHYLTPHSTSRSLTPLAWHTHYLTPPTPPRRAKYTNILHARDTLFISFNALY